jgi:hypothetical protein
VNHAFRLVIRTEFLSFIVSLSPSPAMLGYHLHDYSMTLISGFHSNVDEICALLGYYAASCGNCLPTFRDVSVPSSRELFTEVSEKVSSHLHGNCLPTFRDVSGRHVVPKRR